MTDAEVYSKEDIAELYGFRWNSELDIRSIKQSLNLGHVRCKSPEMVRKELWTTMLGYNLIRTTAAAAALLHDKQPRQISFTSTCQYVLSSWMLLSCKLTGWKVIVSGCYHRSPNAKSRIAQAVWNREFSSVGVMATS